MTTKELVLALGLGFCTQISLPAQGTAFTYQGHLNSDGSPASGLFDFRFRLDADPQGDTILDTVLTNAIPVTNGLFTTTIDFGAALFNGSNYWLEVDVKTNSFASYTVLSPLQSVTPTPYAIFATTASNVSGIISAAQISGALVNGNLPASPVVTGNVSAGSFSGNGANVTSLNANNLTSGTVPLARLSGITSNQLDAATWQLATNLNGGIAALASNVVSGISITNAFITNSVFAGNGGGLTNLNASQLTGGAIPLAQLPASVVTNGASGVSISGSFTGNGAGITNATASSLNGVASAAAAGSFMLASSPAVGNGLVSDEAYPGAVADVNGDGKPDLICANGSINTLTVLTNNGSGVFGSNATLNVGLSPFSVAAADINGDGWPDLICANYSGNTLTIYTNNGGGIFGSNATINVGGGPNEVIAADVNGDGKMDLVVGYFSGSTLTILTNNGSGGFVAAPPVNVAAGADIVMAADVNGDGKVDLICPNNTVPGVLTVLTNNGSGAFVTASIVGVGSYPVSVVAADVYGTGHPALITANQNDNTLTVLTSLGGGIFTSNTTLHVGAEPFYVTAADVNADGTLDLICANATDGTLTVLTNTGSGSFVLNAILDINSFGNPNFVAAVDVNGDGLRDLVALDYGLGTFSIFLNNSVFDTGGNAVIGGNVSAATFAGNGGGLTNVNAATLNGLSAGSFAPASGSINYIQNQTASAQSASFNLSGSATAASAIITGNGQVSGLIRSGSESGTAEAPFPAGLVMRRINSTGTSLTSNSVVAVSGVLTLVRDGTYAGFQIKYPASPGYLTIACMGINNTGGQVNYYTYLANPGTAGTVQIYSNSQNVVHFECTFGITYYSGEPLTQVTLSRYGTDFYWSGNVISTYNQ